MLFLKKQKNNSNTYMFIKKNINKNVEFEKVLANYIKIIDIMFMGC